MSERIWEIKMNEIMKGGEGLKSLIPALLGLQRLGWYAEWKKIRLMEEYLNENNESIIEELGRAPLPTKHGDFTYIVFGDKTTGGHHEALVFGNIDKGSLGSGEEILVRIHSACRTNEVYNAINCECRAELTETLEEIRKRKKGVLIYLEQEGRGTGIFGKLHQLQNMFEWKEEEICQKKDENGKRIDTDTAYKKAGFPSEIRNFRPAVEILHHLGIKSVILATNNPGKIHALEEAGIRVIRQEIHIPPENEIIASDLKSKAENLGHLIPPECYNL